MKTHQGTASLSFYGALNLDNSYCSIKVRCIDIESTIYTLILRLKTDYYAIKFNNDSEKETNKQKKNPLEMAVCPGF